MKVDLFSVADAMRQALQSATTLSPSDVNAIVGKGVESLIDDSDRESRERLDRALKARRLVILESTGLVTSVDCPVDPESIRPDPAFNVRRLDPRIIAEMSDSMSDNPCKPIIGDIVRRSENRNGYKPLPKDEV